MINIIIRVAFDGDPGTLDNLRRVLDRALAREVLASWLAAKLSKILLQTGAGDGAMAIATDVQYTDDGSNLLPVEPAGNEENEPLSLEKAVRIEGAPRVGFEHQETV